MKKIKVTEYIRFKIKSNKRLLNEINKMTKKSSDNIDKISNNVSGLVKKLSTRKNKEIHTSLFSKAKIIQ